MTEMKPVPASTVVIVRDSAVKQDIEVLLLLRNKKLVFHGGHWVFPGGRVDAADFSTVDGGLEYPAAVNAAVRETKEEAGIAIDASQLIHTAHWTTPPKLPRRFCTWFFMYPLIEPVSVSVDNDEIHDHRWISPLDAIAEADAESLILPRPTMSTLQSIAALRSVQDVIDHAQAADIHVFPEDSEYYRPEEMGCT